MNHPAGDLQWQAIAPLNAPRGGLAGDVLDGAVYAVGGWPNDSFTPALGDVERLASLDGPWEVLRPITPRGNPAAAAVQGRLYVIGGYPPTGPPFDVVEA